MNGNQPSGRSGGAIARTSRMRTSGVTTQLPPEQEEMFAILRATPAVPGDVLPSEYGPLFQDVIDELLELPSSVEPLVLSLSNTNVQPDNDINTVTVNIEVKRPDAPLPGVVVRLRSSGAQVDPSQVTTGENGSAITQWKITGSGDFALIAEAIVCGKVAAFDVLPIHIPEPGVDPQ